MKTPCETQAQETVSQPIEQMSEYAVTGTMVLAGQPQPQDWARLARRGFGAIINIRSDPARAADQAEKARARGLRYIHLPLPVYELEADHLAIFNRVISQTNHGKVLLHCRTASRTALLWMLNRIVYEGWSPGRAEAELKAAGYDDNDMDTFQFCAEDFFERTISPELQPQL